MKLAREIAEEIYRSVLMTDEQLCAMEHTIAAKLEPLRDVLYVGLGAAMLVTPRSEPVIDKIKAAIESLSEEE